ncbi:hypothetical protein [Bacillus infantis]|uniref:hypothetical protein n=1 Tax=Bacillus infantis TaxID=324767 RepID=UPI0013EA6313|nr:hypothetical protein [Bacillus infantis]
MNDLFEELRAAIHNTSKENKANALHYLFGAIKAEANHGEESIPIKKLIEKFHEALEEN